jgi:DNA-binding transcriptional ArsR family regulator
MSGSKARPVHDPTLLRAIAHPLRNRILNELSAAGPMRAADVARELGVAANLASFHLRQLAKYGLVTEDTEAARDRRDRVWRLVDEAGIAISLHEMEQAPGGKAAARVFRRTASAWAHLLVDEAYQAKRDPAVFRAVTEVPLRLTKDEARQLEEDLQEVLRTWNDRTRGRDPDRRTYVVYQVIGPYPEVASEPEYTSFIAREQQRKN